MSALADALVRQLGTPRYVQGGISQEIRFNCPFCVIRGKSADTKAHLYVNQRTRKWICHRCQSKGRGEQLLRRLGLSGLCSLELWDTALRRCEQLGLPEDFDEDAYEIEVLGYPPCVPIEGYMDAARYLAERGITKAICEHYGMRLGIGTERGRIIIPTLDAARDVIYWVARKYSDQTWGPKYTNPPDTFKRFYLFNYHGAQVASDTVFICEGVMSAIAAGPSGVAIFGCYLSRQQEDMLVSGGWKHYVVALDGDARLATLNVAERLMRRGCSVALAPLPPNKDPADLTPAERQAILHGATAYTQADRLRAVAEFILR